MRVLLIAVLNCYNWAYLFGGIVLWNLMQYIRLQAHPLQRGTHIVDLTVGAEGIDAG